MHSLTHCLHFIVLKTIIIPGDISGATFEGWCGGNGRRKSEQYCGWSGLIDINIIIMITCKVKEKYHVNNTATRLYWDHLQQGVMSRQ